MFSAYSLRKILPRLLIAVVAIQLSWFLCLEAIQINNAIAHGLEGLIYAPFGGISHFDLNALVAGNAGLFSGSVFTAAAAGTVGFLTFGAGTAVGILALAATAVLGVIIALFTLVLRRAVLLMLIVTAPLAIVCWVLPGTERIWKIWWDSFSKLLLMYPLILLMIAGGRLFAYVAAQSGSNSLLTFATIIIGVFGPLLMIPATLKLAGTAFSTLTNAVNSRNKGVFDRLRNTRGNQAQANRESIKSGHKFKGGNEGNFRGKLNTGLMGASMVGKAGLNPMRARSNLSAAMATATLAHAMESAEKDSAYMPIKGNDDVMAAGLAGDGSMRAARQYLMDRGQTGKELEQNLAHIQQAKRSMGDHNFRIASAIGIAGTGTGYASGSGEMLDAITKASGGDMTLAGNMLNQARQRAEGARRYDLAGAGFGDQYGQMSQIMKAQGTDQEEAAKANATKFLSAKALDSLGPGAILAGRGQSAENLMPAVQDRIERGVTAIKTAAASGDPVALQTAQRDFQETLASTAGLLDVAAQVAPENARQLERRVLSSSITDVDGRTATVSQLIEMNRSNPTFTQMRREYGQAAQQDYDRAQRAVVNPGQMGPNLGNTPGGPLGP